MWVTALVVVTLVACTPSSPSGQSETSALPVTTATPGLPRYLDPSSSWIEIDLVRQVLALHEAAGGERSPADAARLTQPDRQAPRMAVDRDQRALLL